MLVGRRFFLFCASVIILPTVAAAQASPQSVTGAGARGQSSAAGPVKPRDPKAVEAVVITAPNSGDRITLEKRSYSLANDLSAATGSLADALRNVPSVDVDAQGTLSLRGDTNVTVLVDGKPSTQFNGPGRSAALEQVPADQIERVEVLTSPSAEFSPDGSAIINLVMKKAKGVGQTGVGYLTASSAGGKRAGGSFGYNSKALSVTGSGGVVYLRSKTNSKEDIRQFDPVDTILVNSQRRFILSTFNRNVNGRLSADYTLTPKTHLTGDISSSSEYFRGRPFTRFIDFADDGGIEGVTEQVGARRLTRKDLSIGLGLRHSFREDGNDLALQFTRNRNASRDYPDYVNIRIFPPLVGYEQPKQLNTVRQTQFKGTYRDNIAQKLNLVLGYEYEGNNNSYDQFDFRGDSRSTYELDESVSSRFRFDQSINAVYATLSRAINGFDVQAGLRVEHVDLHFRELDIGFEGDAGYTKAYPSILVGYKLDANRQLRFSYSRRVQRPNPILFDPAPLQIDPRNYQSGNPELRPQISDSVELSYQSDNNNRSLLVTAYSRFNRDVPTNVRRFVGDIRYYRIENVGMSNETGLEVAGKAPLSKKFTLNASGRFYRAEIDATEIGFRERSLWGAAGKLNLNWQVSSQDLVQLNLVMTGEAPVGEGTSYPSTGLDLGWRRKFKNGIIATVSAQDVFDTQRRNFKIDTDVLHDRDYYKPLRQSIWLRLDFPLAGGKAKEPGFDFDGP